MPGATRGAGLSAPAASEAQWNTTLARSDANEQSFRCRPRAFDGALAQVFDHLAVHALRREPQREFTQSGEIAEREIILRRPFRRLRHINLAFVESLDEFVRGDVDENDVRRVEQHLVGHGLAHGDAGRARNDIRQAFEMLDIERTPNVDAALQQFIDILPTLGVTAVRCVGVSELIDNDELWFARQRRVYVEFLERNAMIYNLANGQNFLPVQQDLSFAPTMRHGETDYDVNALRLSLRPSWRGRVMPRSIR